MKKILFIAFIITSLPYSLFSDGTTSDMIRIAKEVASDFDYYDEISAEYPN